MPIMIEVTCTRKQKSESGIAQITEIGGRHHSQVWALAEKVAIAGIECKALGFYVRNEGRILGLSVVTSASGHKRLSAGHGEGGAELLFDLPDCTEAATFLPS